MKLSFKKKTKAPLVPPPEPSVEVIKQVEE
jgi:hypothetical protein